MMALLKEILLYSGYCQYANILLCIPRYHSPRSSANHHMTFQVHHRRRGTGYMLGTFKKKVLKSYTYSLLFIFYWCEFS